MDSIRQQISLAFEYPVYFSRGVFAPSNPLLKDLIAGHADFSPSHAVVVLDRGVWDCHPDLVDEIGRYAIEHDAVLTLAPVVVIPGGEEAKNDPRYVEQVLEAINAAGLCRHSYVIAVGGGAVLDVAGYAAATAHRGLRLVRVPTTVLAQDDSAVGVKNGINFFGKKNYLGTFAPPFAVINDFGFLHTLSDRDWRGGIAEAVKAALIRDAGFFDFIEQHAARLVRRDAATMEQLIRRSAELHLVHIATGGDPFEMGSSRPLDYGHWSAHKLEQMTHHRLRHGEAVAIGIALDSTYAYLSGFFPEADWRRLIDLLLALELPIYAPELRSGDDVNDEHGVLGGLEEFREHLGGRLTIMLLKSIGEAFDVNEVRSDVMIRSIEVLRRLAAGETDGRILARPAWAGAEAGPS